MPAPILLTRPADAPRQDLDAYRAAGGYLALEKARRQADGAALLDLVEAAGLRGRGGAAFPAARKWRIAAAQPGEIKHVVANGGEHEPGSDKDKFLVERYPHAVLEGMALCALATGARRGWLYLIEDMAGPRVSAEAAVQEATDAGLLADFEVTIHLAPTTYVAGEESAAIDSIEGGAGKPRKKPPYPGESGVHGQPTTVNNVETLAHVPWIARHGAAAYRALGTAESPGTMLFTLGERFARPGVHEAPFGITWRQLFDEVGGGLRDAGAVRAIQPAMSSAFLGAEHLDVAIAHEVLRPLGTSPGCGGVHVILEGEDPMPRLREIADFFMAEQCGQCPPCRMETNQFAHVLKAVAEGRGPGYAEQIRKVSAFARGKGHCSLIEMAAAPIVSALDVFAVDLERAAAGE